MEYEVLPAVHNPAEAAAPGAPLVFDEEESNVQAYKHVSRGDACLLYTSSRKTAGPDSPFAAGRTADGTRARYGR